MSTATKRPPDAEFVPPHARILTAAGSWFYYDSDSSSGIDAMSIAHALALTTRYAGHIPFPYSVAQHSVLVSRRVPAGHERWALMHDAAEAYLPDVPRPAKQLLPDYCALEDRILCRVARRYGLAGTTVPAEVKHADVLVLAAEVRDLRGIADPVGAFDLPVSRDDVDRVPTVLPAPDWRAARRMFTQRFAELFSEHADEVDTR